MSMRRRMPAELWNGLREGEEKARDLGLVHAAVPRLDEDDDEQETWIIPNPMIIEENERGSQKYDIYSRLLRDRIIFLGRDVSDRVASLVTAQLLFLESQDPDKDVNFYINSPGGAVTAGLAMYDTMQLIRCQVATVCIGQAASMGAFLLMAGAKGKRASLPHSTIMIHQPWGGAQGQATDIEIQAMEILRLRRALYDLMVLHTGRTIEEVEKACVRDNFLNPQQAKDFGIIDIIIERPLGAGATIDKNAANPTSNG